MAGGTRAVLLSVIAFAIAVVSTVTLIYTYHHWQPWLAYHTGAAGGNEANGEYAYWSGFGSVFPWEIGFVAGIWTGVYQRSKRANCHTHGCWRLGSLPAGDGSSYKICKRCHYRVTGTHPTIDHLRGLHHGRLVRRVDASSEDHVRSKAKAQGTASDEDGASN